MIDHNTVASILENIAAKLRDGRLEFVHVQTEQECTPHPVDAGIEYQPSGKYTLSLVYKRKDS